MDVVVTPMRRRHLRGVLRIEERVYPRPWSMGLYLSELGQPATREYLVARAGAHVVGYAGLMVVLEDGHVTNVAVEPAWHRHQIATRLLLQLLRRAVARGLERATLEVRWSNSGAQALYRRFGFAPAGMRKRYYVDNHEDALVMWAHGLQEPAYAERLAGIERAIPGHTRLEGFAA
ncbi:MAG: ribosomal protein S18-alanine N-acetyltransferase [Actinobacteria bacterium]|nr:ribosomal protein S18-alanine N-acetyltransferase [Actinomycetota bacterium]